MKKKLGLPLEYSVLSEYYDVFCAGATDTINNTLEKILHNYNVKTVLDLTCGTGSQVFFLAKHGYAVTGADISPALLEIARKKAHQKKLDLTFLLGDMRTIKAGQFNAVITIFNAIGHLTKPDFEQAVRNIHSNLHDNGLYIFDIFNLDAMTTSVVESLTMDIRKTINDTEIHQHQYSTINRESGQLTSYDSFTIQKGNNEPQLLENNFTLQLYTAEELQHILIRNGFEIIEQLTIDGSPFSKYESPNILTVAKKQS